jgi:hypothetical protein
VQNLWGQKHDMPNLVVSRRFGSTGFDARRHKGLDQCRKSDNGHVQPRRGHEGRQCTQSPIWQTWRARRERVQTKHDFCAGKADTDEISSERR